MADLIAKFEKNKNWQATAKHSDGHSLPVMRGQPGGTFEGKFYLYDETWTSPRPAVDGMQGYSVGEIEAMFSSGELSLVRGSIPK